MCFMWYLLNELDLVKLKTVFNVVLGNFVISISSCGWNINLHTCEVCIFAWTFKWLVKFKHTLHKWHITKSKMLLSRVYLFCEHKSYWHWMLSWGECSITCSQAVSLSMVHWTITQFNNSYCLSTYFLKFIHGAVASKDEEVTHSLVLHTST